jgi:hypothetical protein
MKELRSGCSGHSHRLAEYTKRTSNHLHSWTEAGHLQNNPPRWKKEVQDWCQGVVVVDAEVRGTSFTVETIPFTLNYKARLEGKEYAL